MLNVMLVIVIIVFVITSRDTQLPVPVSAVCDLRSGLGCKSRCRAADVQIYIQTDRQTRRFYICR